MRRKALARLRRTRFSYGISIVFFSLFVRGLGVLQALPKLRRRNADTTSNLSDYLTPQRPPRQRLRSYRQSGQNSIFGVTSGLPTIQAQPISWTLRRYGDVSRLEAIALPLRRDEAALKMGCQAGRAG